MVNKYVKFSHWNTASWWSSIYPITDIVFTGQRARVFTPVRARGGDILRVSRVQVIDG